MSQENYPQPRTPLAALRGRRFLRTRRPLRSLGAVAGAVLVGAAAHLLIGPILVPVIVLGEIFVEARQGINEAELWIVFLLPSLTLGMLLLLGPLVALPVGAVERWRLRLVHPPIRSGHRTPHGGWWRWLRTRYGEAATWREFAYLLLLCFVIAPVSALVLIGFAGYGLTLLASPLLIAGGEQLAFNQFEVNTVGAAFALVPVGAALLAVAPYAAAVTAHLNAVLGRILLGGEPSEALRTELVEVKRSRARLVDSFEAERRRIERDLHDDTQQRLVTLAMKLGLARMDSPAGFEVERSLADAQEQVKEIISSMREIIQGIHPPLLTDEGLVSALPELAERCAFPVDLTVDLPERPPAHVEGVVYFAAAEALGNVAKHTEARRTAVTVERAGEDVVLEVTDDGRGGADPERGTGLTGLADRVAVLGGRTLLSSPVGGPTRIRVEVPCTGAPPSASS
ncbi:sensor histidine kinase [Nocardiopsis valliformis]|uniref:sensor histidine kinase n=1 Tax=Nocardiopsis valliformis TaxID=239974 RepID=UPI000584D99E|nr:sensor domain-containing protein [Nocardiopsis valliformis]